MKKSTRVVIYSTVAGAAVVAAVGGYVLASGPGSFTANGGDQVCVDAPDVTNGSQVTVTDSSGHVIATGTLAEDDSAATVKAVKAYDQLQFSLGSFLGGSDSGMSVYKFSVTVPVGQPRYGVSIGNGNRGTIWFTEQQMRKGPQVSLGC